MQKLIIYFSCIISVILASPQPRNAFDEADVILAEFKQITTEATARAKAYVEKTQVELRTMGEETNSRTRKTMLIAQEKFMARLDQLETLVADHDLNATQCLIFAKRQIFEMPYTLLQAADRCIQTIIEEHDKILDDSFSGYYDLDLTVEAFSDAIEECRMAEDENCAEMFSGELELQNDSLLAYLEQGIAETSVRFSGLENSFGQCYTALTEEYDMEGNTVLEISAECIDDLISQEGSE